MITTLWPVTRLRYGSLVKLLNYWRRMFCQSCWALFRVLNSTNASKRSERLCWNLTESKPLPHTLILGISETASCEIILCVESVAMTSKGDSWLIQFDAFFGMERGLGTESKFLTFSEIKQQYKGVETWREKFLLPGWAGANPKSLSGRWRPAIPVQTAVFYQWSTPRFKITGKDCFGRMVIVKECVPQPVWRRAAGRACHIYHRVVECLGISIPVKTRRSKSAQLGAMSTRWK